LVHSSSPFFDLNARNIDAMTNKRYETESYV